MIYEIYVITDVQPQPWTSGHATPMGKGRVRIAKDAQLEAYQQALREEVDRFYPNVEPVSCDIELHLAFWRNVEGKTNYADVTNIQKATEDALQGKFFDNDRQVLYVTSRIVEQGPGVRPCVAWTMEPIYGELHEWVHHASELAEQRTTEVEPEEWTPPDAGF